MEPVLLRASDNHIIGPEVFGVPGLIARESIGSGADVLAFGALVAVHDSTFEPRSGIGHHPHQGMERLFYILKGAVHHDDSLNSITGDMAEGDLGILTEGERGMLHSESNDTDGETRCYILVYPTDPTPETASFAAIRDADATREQIAPGVTAKLVVERDNDLLNGDIRELVDATLEEGARYVLPLRETEPGLIFVVAGAVRVEIDGASTEAAEGETVLLGPEPQAREATIEALQASRVLHVITGLRYGLHVREFPKNAQLETMVRRAAESR